MRQNNTLVILLVIATYLLGFSNIATAGNSCSSCQCANNRDVPDLERYNELRKFLNKRHAHKALEYYPNITTDQIADVRNRVDLNKNRTSITRLSQFSAILKLHFGDQAKIPSDNK